MLHKREGLLASCFQPLPRRQISQLTEGLEVFFPATFAYGRANILTGSGFDSVQIDGNGGVDAAKIYDSSGDDRVVLEAGRHSIVTPTTQATLTGFTRVEAYATQGEDSVEIKGNAESEKITAKPTHSWLEREERLSYARGFETVVINGGGGADTAKLYDSPADDQFELAPGRSNLEGFGFRYEVVAVPLVHAFSLSGSDLARIVDSDSADGLFASAKGTWIKGDDYTAIAQGFERVETSSQDSRDRLRIEEALLSVAGEQDGTWLIEHGECQVFVQGYQR